MEASRDELRGFFETVLPHLNKVQRRVVGGAMAAALGRGGKTAVAEASGLGRNTVTKGEREVSAGIAPSERLRAPGAGDKPAIDKQPGLLEALDELVWPETRGHPESSLRWTLSSTYELARQLTGQGFKVSAELVRRLLHQMGYSLQAPSKQLEGASHPDRNAQFEYLNGLVAERLAAGEPVISVDTQPVSDVTAEIVTDAVGVAHGPGQQVLRRGLVCSRKQQTLTRWPHRVRRPGKKTYDQAPSPAQTPGCRIYGCSTKLSTGDGVGSPGNG